MTTAEFKVTGMTCGHCVQAVKEELSAVDGVTAVVVDLVPGEASTVTVTSGAVLPTMAVAAAIDEAGYALVDS